MLPVLLLSLMSAVPSWADNTVRDRVSLVELNHCFNENAEKIFSQVILWDWNEAKGRFECVTFHIVKHDSQLPRPDCCGRKTYTTVWYVEGIARAVVADSYRETFTQCFDPEVDDRENLAKDKRRELRPAKAKR